MAEPPFYSLQTASLTDLAELSNLEKICFPLDAWPLIERIGVLIFPVGARIKAVYLNHMIGFVGGDIRKRAHIGWITTIGVLPEFRRKGVGEALLLACEKEMNQPKVRLAVRKTNIGAQILYLKQGYTKVETWPHYYEGGEDAIVMEKDRHDLVVQEGVAGGVQS